jgi:5-methylcytosine-specific restriction endonuclease McrA
METLVLNKNYVAICVTNWKRAINLVYLDRAYVIDEDYRMYNFNDWCEISKYMDEHPSGFVHTPKLRIAIPEVIALKFYDKYPKSEVKFTRRNIYELYGYKCCYCGKKFPSSELNLDHIIPKSRGGKTDWSNVVTACLQCNIKKGNNLPREVGMQLKIKPKKPEKVSRLYLILNSPVKIKSSWQKFIDNLYWNVELEKT